ncbi:MAG: ATP synthase F1 subunit delta [Planctomycetaceae bacterium]|nr:ATP synthase F1 subunit delta [Planctomycetaceae bacterium]
MATNVSDPAARQYAQALLEIGQERNKIGAIFDELMAVDEAYRKDKAFRNFFTSPKVSPEMKWKIIKDSIGVKMSEEVRNFLGLLIQKRREALLDNIMDSFARYRDDVEHRVHVFVESAKPLGTAEKDQLANLIAKATGKTVALHDSVREELIGGLRIRIGDRLLDGTILRGLKELSSRIVGQDAEITGGMTRAEIDDLYERSRK